MAPKSITDLAIQSSGCVHTGALAAHQQAMAIGIQATATRRDDRPTVPHSTPPSRRLSTATRMPPFTIAARAVANASPAAPSGFISNSENRMLATTATAAETAGVLVS